MIAAGPPKDVALQTQPAVAVPATRGCDQTPTRPPEGVLRRFRSRCRRLDSLAEGVMRVAAVEATGRRGSSRGRRPGRFRGGLGDEGPDMRTKSPCHVAVQL